MRGEFKEAMRGDPRRAGRRWVLLPIAIAAVLLAEPLTADAQLTTPGVASITGTLHSDTRRRHIGPAFC